MNKKSWDHFKKNVVVMLTLIFVLGYSSSAAYGVLFADYFPSDPASFGVKTFQWTYGRTGSYQSYISGTITVPYTFGAIEGTGIVNFSDMVGHVYGANDGSQVILLATDEFYISTDQYLTAHPASWTFSDVTDDMLVDQGTCYFVDHDLHSWEIQDDQSLLFDIQNVTVSSGSYSNAIIIWYLDEKYVFTPLDLDGEESGLGITLPNESQTTPPGQEEGYSVTGFDVYGYDTGLIAFGDIDAESGTLVDLAELVDETDHVGATMEMVDSTITTKTKWITCNLWLPPGGSITDIDLNSIQLNGDISPVRVSVRTKRQMLVAKFAASDLGLAPSPDPYLLTISGNLIGGTSFSGSDEVNVVNKGGK
jgi:hypothetical protein